ncbi:hypothetical protein ABC195_11580 [Microbacterium sp. 2P01SA-2]|uniref:hypothetical protein n=1 Tax=unclassified Microbacterium TaxID=2609290 RepID=UPI00399F517F
MDALISVIGIAAAVVMLLVATASALLARSSDIAAAWRGERATVLFVVSTQRWRRIMVRVCGGVMLLVGVMNLLAPITRPEDSPARRLVGMGALLVGVSLLWLAHGMSRMRLEVAPQAVFVSRGFLPPIRIELADITRLRPHAAHRYSGVLAKCERRTAFTATSAMTGYGQLLAHLKAERPDLFGPGGFR